MRSCLLALTWLGAVFFLALQRGSAKAATTGTVSEPTRDARAVSSPRLIRGLLVPETAPAIVGNARYARNKEHGRPVENFVLLDEIEAAVEEDKRQSQFDDYGHMRFGKRGPSFDDYGHMRFGRSPALKGS